MLKNMQKAARALLGPAQAALNDRPLITQSAPARRAPPAAIPTSGLKPTIIGDNDLRPGAFVADQFSVIGYFKIPEGVIYRIPAGKTYRQYIKARAAAAGQNGAAQTTIVSTPGIIETIREKATLPTLYTPDVSAWARVGGVWQRINVVDIDYAAQEVDVAEPASCTEIEVYYTHGEGEYRMRVQRELGNSDDTASMVLNGSISGLHTVDQNNLETSHKWPRYLGLIPGQRLTLEVKSPLDHVVNARSSHELNIQAFSQEITITDRARLRAIAEVDIREGV